MSKQIPVKLDGLIQSPSFGKSPSIDITDIWLVIRTQNIESTNREFKLLDNSSAVLSFLRRKFNLMPQLRILAIFFNINNRTAPSFSKDKLSHSIYLNIKDICPDELLINIVLIFSNMIFLALVLTFSGTCMSVVFSVKHSSATSQMFWVVEGNFMVVRVWRLFDKWFVDFDLLALGFYKERILNFSKFLMLKLFLFTFV
jgi:hypothetical protein